MSHPKKNIPVIIIGGGPVGLYLAIDLLKKGISCRVLEKRTAPVPDSRSLGIHPVSLELFDELGITEPFLSSGLKIKRGLAFNEHKKLGEISFEDGPDPHTYILACPQFETEKILREELRLLDQEALITGAEFDHFKESTEEVVVHFIRDGEAKESLSCQYLIGCDGKSSMVRQQASIHYSGKRYTDTYIMGDFEDTTDFGADAAVFLPKNGMIECFPLPNGMRRWVVKTNAYESEPTPDTLAELVAQRIGIDLHGIKSTMLSSFGVQHFAAETLSKGRILLAGDAAHVVSPIGGQGMNLGWIGASELAELLSELKGEANDIPYNADAFKKYSIRHKKRTRQVARRAEINMALGRRQRFPIFRDLLVQALLSFVIRKKAATMFTMRGLIPKKEL